MHVYGQNGSGDGAIALGDFGHYNNTKSTWGTLLHQTSNGFDIECRRGNEIIRFINSGGTRATLTANGDWTCNGAISGTSFSGTSGTFTGTVNAINYKVNGAQGSDGQVLTSTGSGVAWEDAGGGGGSNEHDGEVTIDMSYHPLIRFEKNSDLKFRAGYDTTNNQFAIVYGTTTWGDNMAGIRINTTGDIDCRQACMVRGQLTAYGFSEFNSNMQIWNGHFYPAVDNAVDLGKSDKGWRNVYTADLHLKNEGNGGNSVDGTEGNWTIQEGEDDLFLLNNRNGKKYKFKLEAVV